MPITLSGDTGITTPMYNGSITANAVTPSVNMKNRIINGAMVINQRGGTVTSSSGGTYGVDRFTNFASGGGVFTAVQSSTVPTGAGFVNSNLLTVTTADSSIASSDFYSYYQAIEGYNTADLEWGTASAKTVTLSFWVRSSVTGLFAVALLNNDGTRGYPATYTISSANTWQQVSVTIAGCTDGTWQSTNSAGIGVRWDLGSGSSNNGTANTWNTGSYVGLRTSSTVNWIATNGATFYITGVQLEVGSTATSFDYRPYGTELQLCQRYALMIKNGTNSIDRFGLGSTVSSTTVQMLIQHPVPFRAAATLTTTGTASDYQVYSTAVTACNAAPTMGESSQFNSRLNFITAGGLTGGQVSQCSGANTNAYLLFSAEL